MSLQWGPPQADETLRGASWCRAYTAKVDAWLADLFATATGQGTRGAALVATGGYGRSELCPQSDIDVMFVHDGDDGGMAEQIWYPIWDAGVHLGHSVCTIAQALGLADDDLHTATALLHARHVAGDRRLTTELARDAASQWERHAKRWLTDLGILVAVNHEQAGDVAFSLEPDLKEGRGGLRDAHALRWAHLARPVLASDDERAMSAAYDTLLAVRVELQRVTERAANVLTLQDQDAVAIALGHPDADALMHEVSQAARVISWTSDDAWRRIRTGLRGPLGRLGRRRVRVSADLQLLEGELHLGPTGSASDPAVVLRAAAAAAEHGAAIDGETLARFVSETPSPSTPWTADVRAAFVALLLSGRGAVSVIEALDQRGVWTRILPEWADVRARPQRNAYHRFTVDRHLLEAVAHAARHGPQVDRADLLVTAALLHDLGKRGEGDHVAVGVELAARIAARMGWTAGDAETITVLVRHHLLLAEVATRRDLDDEAIIERVAAAVGTRERLHLLAALTEADSLATGPAAWGTWKAELVGLLVSRVDHVLDRGEHAPAAADRFPTPEQLRRLSEGGRVIDASDDRIAVMCDDRPGTFSRVAGVLALHGLDVISAAAHSSDQGRALSEFRVAHPPPADRGGWDRVVRDLELALDGRLALSARVAERAATYRRRQRHALLLHTTTVSFDNDASTTATVIDVHAPDGVGVLYRITRALAELDLDIRTAKAETRGGVVSDAFYVLDGAGAKITDPATLAEIARAVLHGIAA